MKSLIKAFAVIFILSNLSLASYCQSINNSEGNGGVEKIHWYTFAEATKLNKKHPKKSFMDVYTSWCGWCKKYDAVTFSHPVIAKYINEHFYAVKFDAERRDTVMYKGRAYVNRNPNANRSVNDLAAYFLRNQMSYPTVVFLNEDMDVISAVPGYNEPPYFEKIVNFFGSDAYKNTKFTDYKDNFKGNISN